MVLSKAGKHVDMKKRQETSMGGPLAESEGDGKWLSELVSRLIEEEENATGPWPMGPLGSVPVAGE